MVCLNEIKWIPEVLRSVLQEVEAWTVRCSLVLVAMLLPCPVNVELPPLVSASIVLLNLVQGHNDIPVHPAGHLGKLFIEASIYWTQVEGPQGSISEAIVFQQIHTIVFVRIVLRRGVDTVHLGRIGEALLANLAEFRPSPLSFPLLGHFERLLTRDRLDHDGVVGDDGRILPLHLLVQQVGVPCLGYDDLRVWDVLDL